MFSSRSSLAFLISAALLVPSAFASHVHRPPTASHAKSSHNSSRSHNAKSSKDSESSDSSHSAKTRKSKKSKKADRDTSSASASAANTDSSSTKSTKKTKAKRASGRTRGQQSIDSERATQIQQALIRENYLSGEASGRWDTDTIAAMQKYQADHGWQTKLMPDSRALKSLGLGPDYSGAINAKGANFTPPKQTIDNIPPAQNNGFVEASGVKQ